MPRLLIRPLELRQACREELRVVERDERVLQARAPQEPHRRCVEFRGVLARDQDENRRRFFGADVRQIASRDARRQKIAAGQGAA